ncbi:hypothetical protein [Streptomyces sp. DH8]|nr:hypothetical protein [Streptomyces sp. DH8]
MRTEARPTPLNRLPVLFRVFLVIPAAILRRPAGTGDARRPSSGG